MHLINSTDACTNAGRSLFIEFFRNASQLWNKIMAGLMQSILPPELRDLIYTHIWDEKFACNAEYSMHPRINGIPTPKGWFLPAVPHVIDETFVGRVMAAEIVTVYYRSSHCPAEFCDHPSQIDLLLFHDAFNIGFCAAMVLRRFSITLDLDHDCSEDRLEETKAYLQKLYDMEIREGFNLLFRLSGKKGRNYQEAWDRLLEALDPIASTFRKKQAKVKFRCCLDHDDDRSSDEEEDHSDEEEDYSDEEELERIGKRLTS
jgi:hypothetical protein